jgi:uncharacterized protein (TIGR03382 family)
MGWRVLCAFLATFLLVGTAWADLPPPPGKKQVGYSFEVSGLGAHGDWVVLGYPYRQDVDGVTRAFMKVEDGKRTRLDPRNGSPKLYAMKKAAFEVWLAKYQPAKDPNDDPTAKALFESDQVVACDHHPEISTLLDASDPRSEVVEAFHAKTLDAKSCQLELAGAAAPAPVKSAAPVAPAKSDPPRAPEPPPAPKKSGCSGCATSTDGEPGSIAIALLAGVLSLFRRRVSSRARPRRSSSR